MSETKTAAGQAEQNDSEVAEMSAEEKRVAAAEARAEKAAAAAEARQQAEASEVAEVATVEDPTSIVTDPTEEFRNPIATSNQFETWRSVTQSKVSIRRIGEYGKPYNQSVPAGSTFTILPRERRAHQVECTKAKFDVFTNGLLAAVELVDGEFDNDSLTSNPNIVEKTDIRKILKLSGELFSERVVRITAPATLQRLLEACEDERSQATVQQLRVVRERLDEISVGIGHVKPSVDQKMRAGQPGPRRDKVDLFEPAELSKVKP